LRRFSAPFGAFTYQSKITIMKKVLFLTLALLLSFCVMSVQAQIRTPAPSPGAKITQTVGLTEITVEYSRPGMKGRTIFGDLVPYDAAWRLGANAATKITFSEDVMFGGKEVKAGAYAMLATPGKSNWTIMLYPHTTSNFTAYLDGSVEPIKVMAETATLADATIENFMIAFDNITSDGASIWFGWDHTFALAEIKTHTKKVVEESIAAVMAGPSANDYYAAASYYASEDKNLEQALEWMNKSIEMGNERFWVLRQKSLLQAKLGDKAGAIATAKRSLELATEAKNNDYVKMNEDSIKEWMM
jgi:hypothetical protein